MATEKFKRKLTAVFSADVVGYSRLMSANEATTVETLTAYREIMASLIKQHRGRVVDSPGDNLLAEFASVVDAAQCAVAIQKEYQSRNADLPEERRMVFRIGINLGDVIEEDERIYGDGVNIAARLESLCDPGGICISKTAFDHIESKLPLGYEYMGEQSVKNIPKPVGAYRVLMEPRVTAAEGIEKKKSIPLWRKNPVLAGGIALIVVIIALVIWNYYFRGESVEPASEERMAFALPETPSIAVLPFVNLSDDPKQDFIGDGITDQIISILSMHPNLFIIDRKSVFTYKGKSVKIRQVAEELGVRYVLDGSVQSVENRIRLSAQLIDALTGKHLWAETYVRELEDVFALQDEITMKVFQEFQAKFVWGEGARRSLRPQNIDYVKKMTEAFSHYSKFTPEGIEQGQRLFKEAIELEPEDAVAHCFLGFSHFHAVVAGISKFPPADFERAFELAQKAIELNASYGIAHCLLGWVYLFHYQQYDKAVSEMEQAADLNPNMADIRANMSLFFHFLGNNEEAIDFAKQAIRLNPFPHAWYYYALGQALCFAGQYEESIEAHEKALHINPDIGFGKLGLAVVCSLSGREKEARAMAADYLLINPRFSVKQFEMAGIYKNRADTALLADTYRKIGLPD